MADTVTDFSNDPGIFGAFSPLDEQSLVASVDYPFTESQRNASRHVEAAAGPGNESNLAD